MFESDRVEGLLYLFNGLSKNASNVYQHFQQNRNLSPSQPVLFLKSDQELEDDLSWLQASIAEEDDDIDDKELMDEFYQNFKNHRWFDVAKNRQSALDTSLLFTRKTKKSENLSSANAMFSLLNRNMPNDYINGIKFSDILQSSFEEAFEISNAALANGKMREKKNLSMFLSMTVKASYKQKDNSAMMQEKQFSENLMAASLKQDSFQEILSARENEIMRANFFGSLLNCNITSFKSEVFQDKDFSNVLIKTMNASLSNLNATRELAQTSMTSLANCFSVFYMVNHRDKNNNNFNYSSLENACKSAFQKLYETVKSSDFDMAKVDARTSENCARVISFIAQNDKEINDNLFNQIIDIAQIMQGEHFVHRYFNSLENIFSSEQGKSWIKDDKNYHKAQDVVASLLTRSASQKAIESGTKVLWLLNQGRQKEVEVETPVTVVAPAIVRVPSVKEIAPVERDSTAPKPPEKPVLKQGPRSHRTFVETVANKGGNDQEAGQNWANRFKRNTTLKQERIDNNLDKEGNWKQLVTQNRANSSSSASTPQH